MGQFRTSRSFDVIFLAMVALFIWWATAHRTGIGDWVYFLNYHPDTRTTAITKDAGLNDTGRRLLYRTDPTFADKATVTAACDIERLGCLDGKGRAYILDNTANPTQATVTAVHEMLHLAYRRLTSAQKADLAPLLDEAVAMNSPDINDELGGETSDDDRRDEAHSLLGTEYRRLPVALEQYYTRYFSDRTKIVTAEALSEQ